MIELTQMHDILGKILMVEKYCKEFLFYIKDLCRLPLLYGTVWELKMLHIQQAFIHTHTFIKSLRNGITFHLKNIIKHPDNNRDAFQL